MTDFVTNTKWLDRVPVDDRLESRVALWSTVASHDTVRATTLWEALEDWWDCIEGWPLPETIVVTGLLPQKVTTAWVAASIIEQTLGNLEEEYGAPDTWRDTEDSFHDYRRVQEIANNFAVAVREEYRPWMHRTAVELTVDVQAWLKERNV